MANIDSIDAIKKTDTENMLQNLQEFPEQAERCWADFEKLALPTRYIQAKSIVIGGVGGSAIAGGLVENLAKLKSTIPIIVWRDYSAPSFINKDTLIIAISYSGNTEETIDFLKNAAKKTDKIITISSGGKLASLSTAYKAFHYKIDYGSQPRAVLGYLFTSLLAIFKKLDILDINSETIRESIILLKGLQKKIDINIPIGRNNAKLLAQKLTNKIPVVCGAGLLSEAARRWKCQFNENSKTAAYFETIPELNHNSLVGLDFPKNLRDKIFIILLESKFDHPRNKLRLNITLQILQNKRIYVDTVMIEPSPTPLAELLQIIHFGDYVSYYLAILNDIEPNPVEIISFLKDKLAEKEIE